MEGNGFDRRAVTDTDQENSTPPAAGGPQSTPQVTEECRKYIEDVDDLDLYMRIYPEAKRRRDEAERQVKLVEAEMKRREDVQFFPAGTTSFCARTALRFRLWMRRVVLRSQHTAWRQEAGRMNIDCPPGRSNLGKLDDP